MSSLMLTSPTAISTLKKGLVYGKNFVIKQAPIVLAFSAAGGVVTTGIMSFQAGIKANTILKELEEERKEEGNETPLTLKEKFDATWRIFVAPVASGLLTLGAIAASSAISHKRQAALAGLYALSESALKEYQDKVEAQYGPKKEQAIRDAVNEDGVRDMTVPDGYMPIPGEKVLVKDKLSGRIFLANVQSLRKAANDLNYRMLSGDMLASLNEFYEDIGLDPIDLGDELGWNIANQCVPYFTSSMTSDMVPILVMEWDRHGKPVVNYRDI